jgi:5-hydroxyisourate hydrolase
MSISTHVLDAVVGAPAAGMAIRLEQVDEPHPTEIGRGVTNADGRCPDLTDGLELGTGVYQLHFDTGAFFARTGTPTLYPEVRLVFEVTDASAHYHVPLLLSPFAFSTYRGS